MTKRPAPLGGLSTGLRRATKRYCDSGRGLRFPPSTWPRRRAFRGFGWETAHPAATVGPARHGWRAFLCNHADGIASIDLFVVPTLSFRLLYGFLVLRHHRRRIIWLGVTASPTAEWIARQLTQACGWDPAPDYIVRDRDCAYGDDFVRRLHAMGIRDRPTAPRSAWQNGYAERLIGSIRREILDHVVVLSIYCSHI